MDAGGGDSNDPVGTDPEVAELRAGMGAEAG